MVHRLHFTVRLRALARVSSALLDTLHISYATLACDYLRARMPHHAQLTRPLFSRIRTLTAARGTFTSLCARHRFALAAPLTRHFHAGFCTASFLAVLDHGL